MTQPFDLWGQRGWCGIDLVGESHFAPQIRRLLSDDFRPGGVERQFVAQLIPEPDNWYDRHAVIVKCQGYPVGYLPREEAARYCPVLSDLVARGRLPQVDALVWAAEHTEDDDEDDEDGRPLQRTMFIGSVRLDLAEPHLLVPANPPPRQRHVLLPPGRAVQVPRGERAGGAAAARPSGQDGEAWVHATLHDSGDQALRVEVRVDGVAVGVLTPTMSSELLPVVRDADRHGLVTVARALLRNSRGRADVVLHVARAGELTAAWLDDPADGAEAGDATAPPSSTVDGRTNSSRVVQPFAEATGSTPVPAATAMATTTGNH